MTASILISMYLTLLSPEALPAFHVGLGFHFVAPAHYICALRATSRAAGQANEMLANPAVSRLFDVRRALSNPLGLLSLRIVTACAAGLIYWKFSRLQKIYV
jgi:hypothetical protein